MLLLDASEQLNSSAAGSMDGKKASFAFASWRQKKQVTLQVPSGLVVSSDDELRRTLAEVLRQCSLLPVLASTVAESGIALAGHEMQIVVCNDRLDDGRYEDT